MADVTGSAGGESPMPCFSNENTASPKTSRVLRRMKQICCRATMGGVLISSDDRARLWERFQYWYKLGVLKWFQAPLQSGFLFCFSFIYSIPYCAIPLFAQFASIQIGTAFREAVCLTTKTTTNTTVSHPPTSPGIVSQKWREKFPNNRKPVSSSSAAGVGRDAKKRQTGRKRRRKVNIAMIVPVEISVKRLNASWYTAEDGRLTKPFRPKVH